MYINFFLLLLKIYIFVYAMREINILQDINFLMLISMEI